MKIRYLTAGESHGPELTAILEGIPSNFIITKEYIDSFLSRRQKSLGSGGRMNIEKDEVLISSSASLFFRAPAKNKFLFSSCAEIFFASVGMQI